MQQHIIPTSLPAESADPLLLERLLQPRLMLFWGAHTPTHTLLTALTTLAAQGHSLRIFDGGNRFDGYYVARLARQLRDRTTAIDPYAVLSRIRLSRAFTCFQIAELIENTAPGPDPLFVLDFLGTFYDESVPLRDSERLLLTCITRLLRPGDRRRARTAIAGKGTLDSARSPPAGCRQRLVNTHPGGQRSSAAAQAYLNLYVNGLMSKSPVDYSTVSSLTH